MITLLHPSIDPVIVSFGSLSIRWYGLSYVIGLILGIFLIKKINQNLENGISKKFIDDFFIWGAIGIILGGRIGYMIFYQFSNLIHNPISIFYIWQGGMSFHGGLLGIGISIIVFSKLKKINFLALSDLVSTAAPIGLFFGRIANFINSELYGKITSFPIAMIFPTIDYERRHPSQLYEALFEGIIIFIVLLFITRNKLIKNRIGLNTAIFLILYGVFRTILETLREPDFHIGYLFNYFTMGQILSTPMIILGLFILLKVKNARYQK